MSSFRAMTLGSSMLASYLVAILGSFFLSGCLMTRSDVEEAQEKQVFKQQLVTIQRKSADQMMAYDNLQDEYRSLNGRIEKIEAFLLQESEKNKILDGEVAKRLESAEKKLQLLETTLLEQDQKNAKALSELRTEVGQSLKDISSSLTAAATTKTAKATSSDKGSFSEAEELFDKKDWRKAILAYEKYRSAYPKGSSYANATYKIGVCFSELGMNTEAAAFYSEVLEKFPKDKIAKSAAYRLKNLKPQK